MLQTEGGRSLPRYYKKKSKEFFLNLGWRVDCISKKRKEDNSGVFVRFPDPKDDQGFAVSNGYEIQIDDLIQPDGKPIHINSAVYTLLGPSKVISNLGKQ